jgi:hypothetical protein
MITAHLWQKSLMEAVLSSNIVHAINNRIKPDTIDLTDVELPGKVVTEWPTLPISAGTTVAPNSIEEILAPVVDAYFVKLISKALKAIFGPVFDENCTGRG